MTHRILKSGKAGQGTLVPTHEPWGTSRLVLFLLFPLGCCCYCIILCLATASLPFPYRSTLSCRSSVLLDYTGLYVKNTDLCGSHWRCQSPWLRERANSLLTLHLYQRDPASGRYSLIRGGALARRRCHQQGIQCTPLGSKCTLSNFRQLL